MQSDAVYAYFSYLHSGQKDCTDRGNTGLMTADRQNGTKIRE